MLHFDLQEAAHHLITRSRNLFPTQVLMPVMLDCWLVPISILNCWGRVCSRLTVMLLQFVSALLCTLIIMEQIPVYLCWLYSRFLKLSFYWHNQFAFLLSQILQIWDLWFKNGNLDANEDYFEET